MGNWELTVIYTKNPIFTYQMRRILPSLRTTNCINYKTLTDNAFVPTSGVGNYI